MISINLKNSKVKTGEYKELIKVAKQRFVSENIGFKRLPYEYTNLLSYFQIADELMKGKKSIVVIGIGGSDLGTRAIHRALNHQYYNEYADITLNDEPKIYFTGDTTDPESISALLDIIKLEETLFLVVSKSGNTIEQGTTFVIIREKLIKENLDPTEYILFITDPERGTLKELSINSGYKAIDIPADVGGRFSVLSTVGMVPAHLLGLDIDQMLKGATELDKSIKENEDDIVSEYVLNKFAQYKSGKNISVMMPYQYSLYEFAKWYQQLWAESLGKKESTLGALVNEGQTPVAVLGPVDQHSQLQLFNEGPNDKFFTFIIAENSRRDITLPSDYKDVEQYSFMSGHNMQKILNFEQSTTAFSLSKNERPNVTISIPQVDAFYLGQLFYFFEVVVTLFGFALDINPFDQPGVELSKNAMYGVLGKDGYGEIKKEFDEWNS